MERHLVRRGVTVERCSKSLVSLTCERLSASTLKPAWILGFQLAHTLFSERAHFSFFHLLTVSLMLTERLILSIL